MRKRVNVWFLAALNDGQISETLPIMMQTLFMCLFVPDSLVGLYACSVV